MSDPTPPPSPPPAWGPGFGPPGYGGPPRPPTPYAQPPGTPVLGILAVVFSVLLAPVGVVLGIVSLATAKGRTAAKILGSIAIGVGLVITAGVVALIVWVVSSLHGAEAVSNQFLTDLENHNAPAAYALTSSQFQARTTEAQLESLVSEIGAELAAPRHVVSSEIHSSTSDGTFTDVVYQVDGTTTSYIEVQVVRQSGAWRIRYVGPTGPPG